MKFEIINPSDAYTFEAPDLMVAATVICLLGNGQYSGRGIEETAGTDIPFFVFGGADEWFTEKFGTNYDETVGGLLAEKPIELAESFESVKLVSGERTSMNNIGGRAQRIAVQIRDKEGNK